MTVPEPPISMRPATPDPAVPLPGIVPNQVVAPEAAALAPVDPSPVAPQRQWIPPQAPVPNAEAVWQAGRAVASGAAQTAGAVASGAAQTAGAVASGAAQTARTAAYRGARTIMNFFAGIGCFFRGAGRFLGSPTLWLYALAPLVLLALALLGIAHAVEAGAAVVIGWLTSFADDWPQWIHDTLGGLLIWGVRVAVHLALGYLVLPLSIVLGAPCYVLLARRLERRLDAAEAEGSGKAVGSGGGGARSRVPSVWRASAVAIRQAVLVTIVVQLGWLLLVPLLLIPGLNVFVAIGTVAIFNGFLVGLLMLAIPLYHHGTSTFRGQLRVVWRHRAGAIGFGAVSGLLLAVPFTPLRALVAPMVFTGAVLLHRRMRKADAAVARAAVPRSPAPTDERQRHELPAVGVLHDDAVVRAQADGAAGPPHHRRRYGSRG